MEPVNKISKLKKTIGLIIIILSMHGCVNDDLSVCGVSVNFTYTKNLDKIDLFAEKVDGIDLFVFDSRDVYIGNYNERGGRLKSPGYSMSLNLFEGAYTFVAWGNLNEDYSLTEFVPGQTTLQEAELSLSRINNIVDRQLLAPLYFGSEKVVLKPAEIANQSITIDMMQDTKYITVLCKMLPLGDPDDPENEDEYTCTITSRNGDYNFENTITGSNRSEERRCRERV